MKSVRFHEYGPKEVLLYEDAEVPEPGPSDVLVKMRACGVNHFDIDVRAGISRWPLPLPHQLGVEFAGEVEAVGTEIDHLKPGDRVWPQYETACGNCRYCRVGRRNLCEDAQMFGVQIPGGYAEYVLAPGATTRVLPDGLSFEQAAAGNVIFSTAWHMVTNRGQVTAADTVVVQAAGSGIGHAAIQVANLAGARVIATAGSPEKLKRAEELGAAETINYNTESITDRVLEMTDGGGADLYIEHVGGDRFMESLASLRKGGRLVTCGGHAGETPPIDIIELFRNEWEVLGSRIGTPEEMVTVFELMGAGKLQADVHAEIPLAEAPEAHRILEEREHTGKVLLVP
jgi:NADPH:quinone reductase-like Zn-dependent oxidoreductase